jgi:hypothetical protein
MQTDDSTQLNPTKYKRVFAFADLLIVLLFFVMFVFEHVFIKRVWDRPRQASDLARTIGLQLNVLLPAIAGVKARVSMGKRLRAGEISPSYASDLSVWLVFFLCVVYLTFASLLLFVPR